MGWNTIGDYFIWFYIRSCIIFFINKMWFPLVICHRHSGSLQQTVPPARHPKFNFEIADRHEPAEEKAIKYTLGRIQLLYNWKLFPSIIHKTILGPAVSLLVFQAGKEECLSTMSQWKRLWHTGHFVYNLDFMKYSISTLSKTFGTHSTQFNLNYSEIPSKIRKCYDYFGILFHSAIPEFMILTTNQS